MRADTCESPGLAVLRDVIRFTDTSAPPSASPETWQAALPALAEQRLLPFVYSQVRRTQFWHTLPDAVQRGLSRGFQQFSIRAFLMDAELARVLDALSSAGISLMLLKGAALGRTVYASSAERPAGDFDVFLRSDDVERARNTLQRCGYRAGGLYWLARWQRRYRAELPMLHQTDEGFRLLLELHWSLIEVPYYIDHIPAQEIWQGARPVEPWPQVYTPAPATLLIHSCAHLAFHHSQDQQVFWLLDIDRLARWPELDWPATLAQADRWHLDLAVRAMLGKAAAWFDTPLPEAVSHWLAQPSDRWQQMLWGLGDETPARIWRRLSVTWKLQSPAQRVRYAAWTALRSLLWLPEQAARAWQRSRYTDYA